MEIMTLYKEIARECDVGKCDNCKARTFCFTAPRSMTEEIVNDTIKAYGLDEDRHTNKDCPIR